jgi:hypothetical protein
MIFRYIDSAHTIAQYANDDGGNAESFPSDHPRFAEVVAQGLAVAAYTPPAITWADIRSKRDGLLAATDWWAVSDRAMSAAEAAYRQALRDVPQTFSSPADVVWPTKPA